MSSISSMCCLNLYVSINRSNVSCRFNLTSFNTTSSTSSTSLANLFCSSLVAINTFCFNVSAVSSANVESCGLAGIDTSYGEETIGVGAALAAVVACCCCSNCAIDCITVLALSLAWLDILISKGHPTLINLLYNCVAVFSFDCATRTLFVQSAIS